VKLPYLWARQAVVIYRPFSGLFHFMKLVQGGDRQHAPCLALVATVAKEELGLRIATQGLGDDIRRRHTGGQQLLHGTGLKVEVELPRFQGIGEALKAAKGLLEGLVLGLAELQAGRADAR
jgi:hypothetical protein